MKWFLFLTLFSVSSFAEEYKDSAFFYVIFSKCQENFVNFSKNTGLDNNPQEKHNLVCAQKDKIIECKLLDSKGKAVKVDRVTKEINISAMSTFRGESGMNITVMKATGGVFFTQTTPSKLDTVSQMLCIGEIKDATDLKQIEVKKEMLKNNQLMKKTPRPPPADSTNYIGD